MFRSYFLAGFECSSHRRRDGRRLDLLASSRHDMLAARDYERLGALGIAAARDGLRWYLIERQPGVYDWSSFLPMLQAAREAGTEVVWDLCHYGWPDDIDIWSPEFVHRFERFAAAVARLVSEEGAGPGWFCPVNEMSFWAWAGGDARKMNPCATGRGGELKRQLVRATIAAIEAVRAVLPEARFIAAEPVIHVDGGKGAKAHRLAARNYTASQFEALDLLAGTIEPELGGRPDYVDVVGVNYYPDNQWYLGGSTIPLGHHAYRPFRDLLKDVFAHYGRPIILSETGAEGTARAAWLHYVAGEVLAARREGVPVEAICLYPVLDCAGWENGRVCPVGLLGEAAADGNRPVDEALLEELAFQMARLPRRFEPAGDPTHIAAAPTLLQAL
jgi:hypothetical protein